MQLPAERRSEISRQAAQARWRKRLPAPALNAVIATDAAAPGKPASAP
jgi:hypothetical protein